MSSHLNGQVVKTMRLGIDTCPAQNRNALSLVGLPLLVDTIILLRILNLYVSYYEYWKPNLECLSWILMGLYRLVSHAFSSNSWIKVLLRLLVQLFLLSPYTGVSEKNHQFIFVFSSLTGLNISIFRVLSYIFFSALMKKSHVKIHKF